MTGAVRTVDQALVSKVKSDAAAAENRRARINLHPDAGDPVQEMIIAFCRDCLMAPHKNENRTESVHVIEGTADVLVFDDAGRLTQVIEMGPWGAGGTSIYRMQDDLWHCLLPKSEFVVVHEVIRGPFEPGTTKTAPWAPAEPDGLRDFLSRASANGPE